MKKKREKNKNRKKNGKKKGKDCSAFHCGLAQ
jgi:hypothetical protein